MEDRYYYLSDEEHQLLSFFGLTNFVIYISNDSYDSFSEDFVIPYSRIDLLARVVYGRKNKSGKLYKKLVSFVDRLQEILEFNETC